MNEKYENRKLLIDVSAFFAIFVIMLVFTVALLHGCVNEVDVQEAQAKEWQKRFNNGEQVDVQVRVVGENR